MLDKNKIIDNLGNTKEKTTEAVEMIINKLKPFLDAVFAKIPPKWIATCIGAFLVLFIGGNAISNNGKLNSDYYVYHAQTDITETISVQGGAIYDDIVNIMVFFKYKDDNIVELLTYKKRNMSKNGGPFSSPFGWELSDYTFMKYKIKNGNEIYTYKSDGSLDESTYWEIEGDTILVGGYELVGMSEHNIRHDFKISGDLLQQNYSKKVRAGKIKSICQQYLEDSENNQ